MPTYFRSLTILAIWFASVAVSAGAPPAQLKPDADWLVAWNGLGQYHGSDKTIAFLRATYPQATVAYERRVTVRGKALQDSVDSRVYNPYDVVVRQGEEELFRADCWCDYYIKEQDWRVRQADKWGLLNVEQNRGIAPRTSNAHFKTAEGIGVGNTVEELRKAYRPHIKTHSLVFIDDDNWTVPQSGRRYSTHIACFRHKSDRLEAHTEPHLELIGFRLETVEVFDRGVKTFAAKGRQLNTYLRDQFDPKAKIVEVITDFHCNNRYRH